MRGLPTALAGIVLALAGCIDQIDLAFELHPDARTILLGMRGGKIYALPPGELEVISDEEPEELVMLSQSIDQLQIDSTRTIVAGTRAPPRPDLGALSLHSVIDDAIDWTPVTPALRLPEFMPDECAMEGCTAGDWDAEWCNTDCNPPAPAPPTIGELACTGCERTRPIAVVCGPGEARFFAGAGCQPLADCAAGFPEDAVYVDPAAPPGGDGSEAMPLQTITEAIAVGASPIVLLPGDHVSPGILTNALMVGACASNTTILGDLELYYSDLERVTVEGDLNLAGVSMAIGVAAAGIVVEANATPRVASISAADTITVFGDLVGERISVRSSVGIRCSSVGSGLVLADVFAEIVDSGAVESVGLDVDMNCQARVERAYFGGGAVGIQVRRYGTLYAKEVELWAQSAAGLRVLETAMVVAARIYEATIGVQLAGGGTTVDDLTIVRSSIGLDVAGDRRANARIDRAFIRDSSVGALRLGSSADVSITDLVVDDQRLSQERVWKPAILIQRGATATITAVRIIESGPIEVEAGPTTIQSLWVEEPRTDRALWLKGTDVSVKRAVVAARASGDDSAIVIGDRFDEGSAAVDLEDIELRGAQLGQGLSVIGGAVTLRRFSISGFVTGIHSEVDPRRVRVSGGRIEGNAKGIDFESREIPRLFDTRLDNDTNFDFLGDAR